MGILCDLIVSAKDKNKDSLMEIINKFRPLIKKQAYALNYEDAEKYMGRKATKNRKIYNGMLKTYYYQFLGPKPPRRKKD